MSPEFILLNMNKKMPHMCNYYSIVYFIGVIDPDLGLHGHKLLANILIKIKYENISFQRV